MAQIQKTATGWRVRESGTWREREDGTRYRDRRIVASGLATKREAQAVAAAHETKLNDPGFIAPSEMTCRQWANDFLTRHRDLVRESTWVGYESILRVWCESFAHVPLQQLQPTQLEAMKASLKDRSPRTQRKVWSMTNDVLTDAVKKRALSWNPATACDAPAPARSAKKVNVLDRSWWEAETVGEFLAFASPEQATDDLDFLLRTGICLNFSLGLRPGELAGLKWQDRSGNAVKIQRSRSLAGRKVVEGEPKTTNGRRDVPLSPAADTLWKALQARQRVVGLDGYLFAIDGVPVHPEKFAELFADLQDEFLAARPELKRLRFYDVRHMAITLWLTKAKIDLRLVSRMAGHSSMYFTADTYAEVLDSDLDDAADKMGALFGGGQLP